MEAIYRYTRKLFAFIAPFFAMLIAHYTAANVYTYMCANLSIYGLLTSMLTTSSPMCSSILAIVTHTQTSYAIIVSGLIGFGLQKLILPLHAR
jgi:hypothetical protein